MAGAYLGQLDKARQYANEYKQRMVQLGQKGGVRKIVGTCRPICLRTWKNG